MTSHFEEYVVTIRSVRPDDNGSAAPAPIFLQKRGVRTH